MLKWRNLNGKPEKSRYSVITVRGYMDGDYIISNYGTIKVKNPLAYKDTAGGYEVSNEGINSHYITHHIADSSIIKSIKRPNILKR